MSQTVSQTEKTDQVRQLVVVLTVGSAVVAAVIGSGVLGGQPIDVAAGGAFAAGATVLSMAGIAFAIWAVILLGLVLYAIWQAVPAQSAKPVHRVVGYGIAASALLSAAWVACVQAWRIAESFVIIMLLLGVLLVTFVRIGRRPQRGSIAQLLLVDGTVGLALGWVTVLAAVNLAAWLAAIGLDAWAVAPGTPGTFALLGVGVVAAFTAWRGGRWAPAIATTWGLVWIAVGRWSGAPDAPIVATTAIMVAGAALMLAAVRFAARVRAER